MRKTIRLFRYRASYRYAHGNVPTRLQPTHTTAGRQRELAVHIYDCAGIETCTREILYAENKPFILSVV